MAIVADGADGKVLRAASRPVEVSMSGEERPVWTPPAGYDGCRLRDQLTAAIDAICWQAGLVGLAQALDPADERPDGTVEAAP